MLHSLSTLRPYSLDGNVYARLALVLACLLTFPDESHTHDNIEDSRLAPANDTPRSGAMNGQTIRIPERYLASSTITMLSDQSSSVKYFVVYLRRSNFKPISTVQDLKDWEENWLKPYSASQADHRWFGAQFRSELYLSNNTSLRSLYGSLVESARKTFASFVCNERKLGLQHCISRNEKDVLDINEIYYDDVDFKTVIACTNIYSIDYHACDHYFSVPSLRAVGQIGYLSFEELAMWKTTERQIQPIADEFAQ